MDHFFYFSCRSDKFSFPSFTASIESLPALNEGNKRENYRNLKRPCTFKSEGNLLGLRGNNVKSKKNQIFIVLVVLHRSVK